MISSRKQLLRSTDRSRQKQHQSRSSNVEFTPIGGKSSIGISNYDNNHSNNNTLNGSPSLRRHNNSNNNINLDTSFVEESNFTGADIFEDDINLTNDDIHTHEYNHNNNFINQNDNIISGSQDFNPLKTQNSNIQDLMKDNINLKIYLNSLKAQLDNVPRDKLELVALNSQLELEVNSLRKKLDIANKNNNNNISQMIPTEKYHEDIHALEDENHQLQSDLKYLQEDLKLEKSKRDEIQVSLNLLQDSKVQLQNNYDNQISRLKDDLIDLKDQLRLKDDRINEMNEKKDADSEHHEKLQNLQDENYDLQRELRNLKDSMEEKLDELEKINDNLEKDLSSTKNEQRELERELDKLSDLDKQNQFKINELRKELNEKLFMSSNDSEKVKKLNDYNNELSDQVKQLTSQNHSLSDQLHQLKLSLKSNDNQLIQENESLTDKIVSLKDEIYRLKKSNRSNDNQLINELTNDNEVLNDKVKSLQDEIVQVKRTMRSNDQNQIVRELNSDNEILTDALNEAKIQLSDQDLRIKQLKDELLDYKSRLNLNSDMQDKVTELNTDLNSLNEELNDIKHSNKELIEQLTEFKFMNDSLKQDKVNLLDEIDAIKDAFDEELNKFRNFRDDYNFRLEMKENEINDLRNNLKDLKLKSSRPVTSPSSSSSSSFDNTYNHEILSNFENASRLYDANSKKYEAKINELNTRLQNSIPLAKYSILKDDLESTKKEIEKLKSELKSSNDHNTSSVPTIPTTNSREILELETKIEKLNNEKLELMKSINSFQVTQDKLSKDNDKLSNELNILRLELSNNKHKQKNVTNTTSESEYKMKDLNDKIKKLTLDLESNDQSYNELIMSYNSMKNELISKLEREREEKVNKAKELQNVSDHEVQLKKELDTILSEKSKLENSLKTNTSINEALILVNNELHTKIQELENSISSKEEQQQKLNPMTPPSSIKRAANQPDPYVLQHKIFELERMNHINKEKLKLYSINKKEMNEKLDFLKSVNSYLETQLTKDTVNSNDIVDQLSSLATQDTTNLLNKPPSKPLNNGKITNLKQFLTFYLCYKTMVKMMERNRANKALKNEIKSNILGN